jgi:AcrR family transcriptional regulator
MRAQSLYVYFPSKHSMLDAMFAEGYARLLERISALPDDGDPRTRLHQGARAFLAFAVEDLARYQLLFQRVIPGFAPSETSYAAAVQALAGTRSALAACGATRPEDLDLYTAVLGGLAAQQTSNEPGGDRWTRLVDEAVDMYLAHVAPEPAPEPTFERADTSGGRA